MERQFVLILSTIMNIGLVPQADNIKCICSATDFHSFDLCSNLVVGTSTIRSLAQHHKEM